jgi:hypothetical protein
VRGEHPFVRVAAYGQMKWNQFENQLMPDDPVAFLEAWTIANKDLHLAMNDHENSINVIDDAVSTFYHLSDRLRDVLKVGPPWLARRAATIEQDEVDEG